MQHLFQRLLSKIQAPKCPVIIVGSGYPSYALCEKLSYKGSPCKVLFFIDEEPWTHKTYLLGAQLRYPAELIALVERYNIKTVLCCSKEDYQQYQRDFEPALKRFDCSLLLCNEEASAEALIAEISR